MTNEKKKEDMPACQCPFKKDNDGKCHKECLIFKSAMKKK